MPFERVRPLIGKGGDKLLPEVTGLDADSPKGKAITQHRADIFRQESPPSLRPFPGARELLQRLKAQGLRLAVAGSSKSPFCTRLVSAETGIDVPTAIAPAIANMPTR